MSCAFCGEGDRWIKTCRTEVGLVRVCDPCWEARACELVIVSGDGVVTTRCQRCGGYFNPREMAEVSPGGKGAFSGACRACAEEGIMLQRTDAGRLRIRDGRR